MPQSARLSLTALLIIILSLAACGGGSASDPAAASAGDARAGKDLFHAVVIRSAGSPGCDTCHSLEKGKALVGPSLAGLATRAKSDLKSPGYMGKARTTDEMLKESVLEPDVRVAAGLQSGIMPKTYNRLSAQELGDLIAYLTTLK